MYATVKPGAAVVQKYGGTSVADAARIKDVAARIARQHRNGWRRLAIVVSARAGDTNKLVAAIDEVNPRASGQAYDLALAAGEQVTVALLAAALESEGVLVDPFLAYQLGIKTDGHHARARIHSIEAQRIEASWTRGAVAVVAGFQGVTDDSAVTTLGRGGSDTSAVALAVALSAAFCEINTDVDGVFTADPRHVPQARLIERMDYETALEMASLGSKVLHPRSVELGAKWRMPIVVRNSFTPDDHQRTLVMPSSNDTPRDHSPYKPPFESPYRSIESLVVSGVTLDRAVARVTVFDLPDTKEAIAAVFAPLGALGLNLDIIVHDRPNGEGGLRLGFTLSEGDLATATDSLERLKGRAGFGGLRVGTQKGLAKVSAVGVGMRNHAGVAGRVFRCLAAQGIEIQMVSTSEIKISVVVSDEDAKAAMRALHSEFVEGDV